MSIRILVEEEWGYKHHLWTYDGTKEELIEDWLNYKWPELRDNPNVIELISGYGPAFTIGNGVPIEIEHIEHDARAHIHMRDDSWLLIDGKPYYSNKS